MKEKLSAMMDSALTDDECDGCVRRLKDDPELRAAWDLYHLIGDSMRGHTAPHVADQVRARLAAEPTILAPRRTRTAPAHTRLAWYPLAAAASAAAVALVGWLALPLFDIQPGAGSQTIARSTETPATVLPAAVPPAQGLADYLLAHQRFSPSIAMGGLAPYIRTVAEESGAR
jgi:sigma-E factor negative regulatory protein RseA